MRAAAVWEGASIRDGIDFRINAPIGERSMVAKLIVGKFAAKEFTFDNENAKWIPRDSSTWLIELAATYGVSLRLNSIEVDLVDGECDGEFVLCVTWEIREKMDFSYTSRVSIYVTKVS